MPPKKKKGAAKAAATKKGAKEVEAPQETKPKPIEIEPVAPQNEQEQQQAPASSSSPQNADSVVMDERQLKNAAAASAMFGILRTSSWSNDAAAQLRRQVLKRMRYPSQCPPPKGEHAEKADDAQKAPTTGHLILHGTANNGGNASSSVPLSGGKGPSVGDKRKRLDDEAGVVEDRIIAVDADVLRQRTMAGDTVEGEPERAHLPWKLKSVCGGHSGAIRAITVDPSNAWFATGSQDTTIRVHDLASLKMKLVLTGHKATVRSLCISPNAPYMISGGEDNAVKMWDLETNSVTKSFFGHRSAVNAVAVHPELDVVVSASHDRTLRLWDMRSANEIMVLRGHEDSVLSVATQASEPQLISGGADAFIYLWDLKAGKAITRLTRHRKAVASVVAHPTENTMASVGADNVRKWKLPSGEFFTNMNSTSVSGAPQDGAWNTAAINGDNVLFVGSRDGKMRFYDWGSHRLYQHTKTKNAKGTLEAEGGVRCCTFDVSGTRLLVGEGDKTVKIWHQVANKK